MPDKSRNQSPNSGRASQKSTTKKDSSRSVSRQNGQRKGSSSQPKDTTNESPNPAGYSKTCVYHNFHSLINYKIIHIVIFLDNMVIGLILFVKFFYFVIDHATESRPLSEIDPDMQKLDGEDSENSTEPPKEEPKIITIVNKS